MAPGTGMRNVDTVARPGARGRQRKAPVAGDGVVPAGGVVLGRDRVPELQRARILAALVELTRERNTTEITVAHIVTRAGVSRRTFYELFADRDACFLGALQDAVQRAAALVEPAFDEPGSWAERIRGGLGVLLGFLDQEPGLAGLCIVDALAAGPAVLRYRAQILGVLVSAVDQGRRDTLAGAGVTRLTAEGVVGGVLAVLYARLATLDLTQNPRQGRRSEPSLTRLLSPLMAMIVLPYLGSAAAAREAQRPTPRFRTRARPVRSNPLEGLDMRLTYRTIRVLVAIAHTPEVSNRQVAQQAGIHDQGQISKLLARLEHLGLIANSGGAHPGQRNAWQLTTRGEEVHQTIQHQTTPQTT